MGERRHSLRDCSNASVIWLADGSEGGGVGRSLTAMADALEPHGVAPQVICLSNGPLAESARAAGLSVTIVLRPRPAAWMNRAAPRGLRTPVSLIPGLDGGNGIVRNISSSLSRLPIAVNVRTPALLKLGGRLARELGVPLVWQVANAPGPRVEQSRLRQLVYRRAVLGSGARVLANSRYVAHRYRFLGDVPYAYPPLHGALFARPYAPPPSDELRLLSLGRVTPEKGQHIILEAFAGFLSRGGKGSLQIMGLGTDTYSQFIRRATARLHSARSVTLTDFGDDIVTPVEGCSVMIAGHTTAEAFGQSAAQAIALGRPVLAVGSGGPAELVERSAFGWHQREFTVNGLVDAFQRVEGEIRGVESNWSGARCFALREFSPEAFATSFLSTAGGEG